MILQTFGNTAWKCHITNFRTLKSRITYTLFYRTTLKFGPRGKSTRTFLRIELSVFRYLFIFMAFYLFGCWNNRNCISSSTLSLLDFFTQLGRNCDGFGGQVIFHIHNVQSQNWNWTIHILKLGAERSVYKSARGKRTKSFSRRIGGEWNENEQFRTRKILSCIDFSTKHPNDSKFFSPWLKPKFPPAIWMRVRN